MRSPSSPISLVVTLVLATTACSPPLDPETGDTGGPLSASEQATDVLRYELELEVFPGRRSIHGAGTTVVRALEPIESVEVQLDPRFEVGGVLANGHDAGFTREGGIITVNLPQPLPIGDETSITIEYGGRPYIAENAPWAGGFVWNETEDGRPWIATAVQGEGCDMWWPCKDHFRDKPEGIGETTCILARGPE